MKYSYIVEAWHTVNGIPARRLRRFDTREKALAHFEKARRSALLINVFCRSEWTDTNGKARVKDGPAIAHDTKERKC